MTPPPGRADAEPADAAPVPAPAGPVPAPPGPVPAPAVPVPAPAGPTAWEGAMRAALAEAAAAGSTGDVPVGAVVLDPAGGLLAAGRNEREALGDPTAHAEVVALRRAAAALGGWRLDGCTLVVTLEPCTMCAGALVLARVARLVYGAVDPKAGAVGSLWDVVRDRRLNSRPQVVAGVLDAECGAVLREFFAARRQPRRGAAGAEPATG